MLSNWQEEFGKLVEHWSNLVLDVGNLDGYLGAKENRNDGRGLVIWRWSLVPWLGITNGK